MSYLIVYATMPTLQVAKDIAQTLLQEKLVACANLTPNATSLYWWQGEIQEAQEVICIMKTTKANYAAMQKRIVALHPYEVPCIVAMPLTHGNPLFLQWIDTETQPAQQGQ